MVKKRELSKIIFIIAVLLSFGAIYIYNVLTPYLSDDLLFDQSIYHSFWDIFREEYRQYMNWNGRSVLQIILKICKQKERISSLFLLNLGLSAKSLWRIYYDKLQPV